MLKGQEDTGKYLALRKYDDIANGDAITCTNHIADLIHPEEEGRWGK